jgi:hypothetical protein
VGEQLRRGNGRNCCPSQDEDELSEPSIAEAERTIAVVMLLNAAAANQSSFIVETVRRIFDPGMSDRRSEQAQAGCVGSALDVAKPPIRVRLCNGHPLPPHVCQFCRLREALPVLEASLIVIEVASPLLR